MMTSICSALLQAVPDRGHYTAYKVFPNQKPWVDQSICKAVNTCTTSYNTELTTGDMEDYKAASYNLHKVVKEAKRNYR